jgi:hypothetical protein
MGGWLTTWVKSVVLGCSIPADAEKQRAPTIIMGGRAALGSRRDQAMAGCESKTSAMR